MTKIVLDRLKDVRYPLKTQCKWISPGLHKHGDCEDCRPVEPTLSEIMNNLPEVDKFIFERHGNGIVTLVANGIGYGPFDSFEQCAAEAYITINVHHKTS